MSEVAEATLDVEEPDSLDDPAQEPEAVEGPDVSDLDELAAAAEAEAEQPEDADAAVDEDDEAVPSEGPSADDSPPGEPFSFRVDGKTVDVEGAIKANGRIEIPEQAWGKIQQHLADRGVIQQREERMSGRIRQLESEAESREDRFKAVMSKVDELLSDPEAVRRFAEQYQVEAPRFRLEVENSLLKSRTQDFERRSTASALEAEDREFNENAPVALRNAVNLVADHVAKDVNLDRDGIAKELQGLWDAKVPIFFPVKEGDGSGLDPREHKWGVNVELIERLMTPHIERGRQTATAQKAERVAQRNATAVAPKKSKAPPTAPAQGSPTPGGESKYPETREEYEAWKAQKAKEYNLPM